MVNMVDDPTVPMGDVRQDADSDRQGAFKRGWTAAVKDLDDGESSKYSGAPTRGTDVGQSWVSRREHIR